jgi:hypothetical protein
MTNSVGASDARAALTMVEYSRQQVVSEIGMPRWYWLGLAAGWIGMGVITDFGPWWLALAVVPVFGAAHATVGSRVMSGRRRSSQLRVREEVAGAHIPALVIGFLLGLVGLTILAGLLIDADGARHPATIAGVIAGVAVASGGPELMAVIRRRTGRDGSR